MIIKGGPRRIRGPTGNWMPIAGNTNVVRVNENEEEMSTIQRPFYGGGANTIGSASSIAITNKLAADGRVAGHFRGPQFPSN